MEYMDNMDEIENELHELLKPEFRDKEENNIEIESVTKFFIEIEKSNINLWEKNIRNNIMEVIYNDCIYYINDKNDSTPAREAFKEDYKNIYIDDKNSDNEVLKTAFGKKGHFNGDYDASLIANYIYRKTIFAEKPIVNIEKYKVYEHIISYRNENSNDCFFRGDTMNSWSTTLDEFFRLRGDEYLNNLKRGKNKKWCPQNEQKWVEFLSVSKNYKKDLPSYITDFMKVVYTIGNFIPVPIEPESFNTKRSNFACDYWDLTLLAIYEYYMHGKRPTIAQAFLGKWAFWFDDYGTGQAGWDSFVEENYMQPFVNKIGNVKGAKYGMPYELWDGHFNGGMLDLPQEQWQFEQFFVNAKVRILERGELIATALVGEPSNENETQK